MNSKVHSGSIVFYVLLYASLIFSLYMINVNNQIKAAEQVRAMESTLNHKFMVSLSHSIGGGSLEAFRILNVNSIQEFYALFKESEQDYLNIKHLPSVSAANRSNMMFNITIVVIATILILKAAGVRVKFAIENNSPSSNSNMNY